MRRITRLLLWIAGAILAIVLVTASVTQTTFFKHWLRGVIVQQANQHLNGTLSIGQLRGNLYSGIELDQVAVQMDNQPLVSIDVVTVAYDIRALVAGGTTIERVSIVHPVVAVRREGDGWQFGRLVKKDAQETDRRGPNRAIAIRHITITDGSFVVDKPLGKQAVNLPRTIDTFNAVLSFAYAPVHYTIGIGRMSFVGADPQLTLNDVSGAVTVKDDNINLANLTVRTSETRAWVDGAIAYRHGPMLALQVSLTPVSLPEIHRLVPAMKEMNVRPEVNLKLSGPASHLATEVSVRSDAVNASAKGTLGLGGGPDRTFQGEIAVPHLDLAPFLNNPKQKSDITVYAKANLRGPAGFDSLKGTVAADAPRVSTHGYLVEGIRANATIDGRTISFDSSELAYKSNATSAGFVAFASDEHPVTRFDFRGVVKDVGVAYLPAQMRVPPADTKLTANYHVRIEIPRAPGWHLDGDATLDPSTVAGVAIGAGGKTTFEFGPGLVRYTADMDVANVDLTRIGNEFNFNVLRNPRYKTLLAGHVNAAVEGTAIETMTLKANGTLTDSSAFGGRFPAMTFDGTLADDVLHITAGGQVDKVDAALAANTPSLEGSITGHVDTDITFHHISKGTDLHSVEGSVTADLGPSTAGRVGVDRAYVDGTYHDTFADIQTLELAGSGIVASGNGTLAFNETGTSGFWIHAEASHLDQIGTLANAPDTLTGIGTVDAVISGNRNAFIANGTATGDGLKYGGGYGALAASATFTATLPELDAEQATVTADTHATFVDLPGLQVNELTAKTAYTDKRVAFDLTATQPQRTLTAAGALLFLPDNREVHLQRLKLDTQGMSWQTEQGHEPVISYADRTFGVKDFALVNGQQEITAEGAIGHPNRTLTLALKNVDLSIVDAWLLRPPQLSGTVNAKSIISGARDAVKAYTVFAIDKGKFRDVPYASFSGTVQYSPTVLVMDTTLTQNASQWLTAKGTLPLSLVTGRKNATDGVDFHVDSSEVDLGLVQGLTTRVSAVKGMLQAHLDVTGTADKPRVAGAVTVQGGALKVEDTGVSYARLDGRVEFLPDRVHITDLHVLDSDNQSLSLTGDLGVSGFQVSAVNLGAYADNFTVLGNEMGSLRVNTNLELTGTLAHPALKGDVDVSTGSLNLDTILARVNNAAYATTAADAAKTGDAAARRGVFGPMDVAVHLTIPNDLIIKASDLKTSRDARGLGAVNITLGGNLNVAAGPSQPVTLVGSVNTIRGFYDYQGRRFTILRDGSIRFEGDAITRLDPSLNVVAERVIQAVTVHVNVGGRLRRPDITLTSTPPQDQADILALIVFNQPLNAIGASQQISLAQRAGSIAAGAVTSQLTGSIANSLNLDQFDINLSPDSGSAAQLTVGQQLGQNLYVKVQQGIGNYTQTNVVLEYEFAKWLRLQTNVLQGANTQEQLFQRVQSTGLDLVFSFAFK